VIIRIEVGPEGAEIAADRRDIAIIIDTLRASSTIITALSLGVTGVISISNLKEAFSYRNKKDIVLAGEKQGLKIDGLDFGNSPTELINNRSFLKNKTLVLLTSNGTKCIQRAQKGSSEVLIGALINLHSASLKAYQLSKSKNRSISLIAAGYNGSIAEEDIITAELIKKEIDRLENKNVSKITDEVNLFNKTQSSKRLMDIGYSEDVEFCQKMNIYQIVPHLRFGMFMK